MRPYTSVLAVKNTPVPLANQGKTVKSFSQIYPHIGVAPRVHGSDSHASIVAVVEVDRVVEETFGE